MIKHVAALHAALEAAGILITGVDSNGQVSPRLLQKTAQTTIDNFDDSDEAEDKRRMQASADTIKMELRDPASLTYQTLLAVGLSIQTEIKKAVPTYTPQTKEDLATAIDAQVDANQQK